MTYNSKKVEVLSQDDQTAVIKDDEGIKCVAVADLKDEKKSEKKTETAEIPPKKSKK